MDKAKGSEEELAILFKAAKRKSWKVVKRQSRETQTPLDWNRQEEWISSPSGDQHDLNIQADEFYDDDIDTKHSSPPDQRIR